MAPYLFICIAFRMCIVVHLLIIVKTGELLGAQIKVITLGTADEICGFNVGHRIIRLRFLPNCGNVLFVDTEDLKPDSPLSVAFRRLPCYRQAATAASGCIALILISASLFGRSGRDAFMNGFAQIIKG